MTTSSIDSAIEVETIEFSPAEFSFSVFLEETIDLFRIRTHGKGIVFMYHTRDQFRDRIYADDRQLRTILEYLLNHAVQMTQAGGLTFSVEVLGQSSSGSIPTSDSQLRFQVEDTGCSLTATALKLRILESQSDGRCPPLPLFEVTPTPELDSIQ